MKAPHATATPDLLPDYDLAGERLPKPTRLDKMRQKRGLMGLSANLPIALVEEFHAKRKARGHTVNQALETLLRTQYLRKR